MIAIIDYDAGNIKSVEKALLLLGQEVKITDDAQEILSADKVVLPGVGAFGDAMGNLERRRLVPVIRETVEKGTPFLGICLGLQLLFERSDEAPGVAGLGILPGEILRIPSKEGLKIPHMGWNCLGNMETKLFQGIESGSHVYFVHSYFAGLCPDTIATTGYGQLFSASLKYENFYGVQFHPEKSGAVGERILQNFLTL